MKLRLLDLFCGAGGCSVGYKLGGFHHVEGVDLFPQSQYPYKFTQANALDVLRDAEYLRKFDVVHCSPPCQHYSIATSIVGTRNKHPDLVAPVRDLLLKAGVDYVIENVPQAPLRATSVLLCGTMFGLKVYRHRLFECSFPVEHPAHPTHTGKLAELGRRPKDGEFVSVVGNLSRVHYHREAMGIWWMFGKELSQAIPPAYTQYLAKRYKHQRTEGEREAQPGSCVQKRG